MNSLNCRSVWGVTLCALRFVTELSGQTITIKEVNPTHSEAAGVAATGGRVNHLARASNGTLYAASEFGGLFKSTDAGRTWSRLDGYLPHRMWGVKVSPANPNFFNRDCDL